MQHVTTQMIRQFLLSVTAPGDSSVPFHEWAIPIGTHLIHRCEACLQAVYEAFAQWRGLAPTDPRVKRDAFEFLYRRGVSSEELIRQAKCDADELLQMRPTTLRHRLASEELRFRAPALVDELIARCEVLLTADAANALEVADLAVKVALRTEPEVVGSLAFHARARAAAHRGNCLRLRDRAQAAEDAFKRSVHYYQQAPRPEPAIEAELRRLEASLAIDQRRFDEARLLMSRAMTLYGDLKNTRALCLLLIKSAHAAYQEGEPTEALLDLRQAATLIDLESEPRLQWTLRYNFALYALESGNEELAHSCYVEHRELLESQHEPWFALRLLWLRAKMARAEGESGEARKLFAQARAGFVAEDMGFDAALVSLELAVLHLESGDAEAVKSLAAEMLPIFQSQDVHREALAALVLFQQAAYEEELTTEMTAALRRYLQLSQRDPSLTFQEFQSEGAEEP